MVFFAFFAAALLAGADAALSEGHFIVAHRGASGAFPEHTLPAYEYAAEVADFIECDVVLTSDKYAHVPRADTPGS
jgi:glycerophosphoryl diester phosphodiesterase